MAGQEEGIEEDVRVESVSKLAQKIAAEEIGRKESSHKAEKPSPPMSSEAEPVLNIEEEQRQGSKRPEAEAQSEE